MVSRKIWLGGRGVTKRVAVGGGSPISVQTMWKAGIRGLDKDVASREKLIKKIDALSRLGCDIVRFAVPDMESACSLCAIAAECKTPLIADIHFDYRLALACLNGNVAAIRINPGNIGAKENVAAVVKACRERSVPVRIGVNSGSLPKDLAKSVAVGKISRAVALSEAAARELALFNELNFFDVAVSMKSSDADETVTANEIFAKQYDAPLHIGVTEAGPLITGIVKSTLAFSKLLAEGIGDTIRVSLSSAPENEVIAGREILRSLGLRKGGVKIISCPRCGREGFDVHGFVERWQTELLSMDKDITVAIMGCVVNGPGEARHADIGIAGSGEKAVIFKKGKILRTTSAKDADKLFREALESL